VNPDEKVKDFLRKATMLMSSEANCSLTKLGTPLGAFMRAA